ncbi:hypothetical protein EVAR_836_1 [Eumeta japonica]|uniref:Uncharacterized protein n=1 Tax=Eumeta variegata TaxID=151549 RepID=A0A4C1SDH4_EUMVA|nr:hypothetical protein EVAR_836_1 [Eumeta japonica]
MDTTSYQYDVGLLWRGMEYLNEGMRYKGVEFSTGTLSTRNETAETITYPLCFVKVTTTFNEVSSATSVRCRNREHDRDQDQGTLKSDVPIDSRTAGTTVADRTAAASRRDVLADKWVNGSPGHPIRELKDKAAGLRGYHLMHFRRGRAEGRRTAFARGRMSLVISMGTYTHISDICGGPSRILEGSKRWVQPGRRRWSGPTPEPEATVAPPDPVTRHYRIKNGSTVP